MTDQLTIPDELICCATDQPLRVDDDDLIWVSRIVWFREGHARVEGMCSKIQRPRLPFLDLGRAIMLALPGDRVEHIDPEQPMNFTRANLRLIEPQQRFKAWRPHPAAHTVRGAIWNGIRAHYAVHIKDDGHLYKLGFVRCPRVAGLWFDAAARVLAGDAAALNFPWRPSQNWRLERVRSMLCARGADV